MNQTLLNQELFSFIKESPTNYHAITAASRLLADQGFTPLLSRMPGPCCPEENIM